MAESNPQKGSLLHSGTGPLDFLALPTEPATPPTHRVEAIRTEALTKFYGKARGITDLDLTVYEGETFGFLGPNGAGKTTTIRLLMDLIRPTGGHASIFGTPVRDGGPKLRAQIGYLPGELGLWPNLTGKQILHYLASERGGPKTVDPRHTAALADRLSLDLNKKFREYSKGNKQKIGLVQAFMHRPRLLILDEPTGGLDPLNQQEFFKMLAEARANGATVLLSTHILGEVEQTSDRVGIIRDGKMVRVGPLREVVKERSYLVTLTLSRPVTPLDIALFDALPGIRNITATDRDLSFTVHGPVDPILKRAARLNVLSITSREPTLEEAFLEYYKA